MAAKRKFLFTVLSLVMVFSFFSFPIAVIETPQTVNSFNRLAQSQHYHSLTHTFDKPEKNWTEFWQTVRAQASEDFLYPRTYNVEQVTSVLRRGKIIFADLFIKQSSLKLKITFAGGQLAIFKPLLIDRENKSTRVCNVGCEHPEYEVTAFTLNRMFDLRNMPYTTGRNLSWSKDLEPVASSKLKNFGQIQDDLSVCFNWSCARQSNKTYCFKNGEIPGAVIYFIQDRDIQFMNRHLYHGYYAWRVVDKKDLDRLPGDQTFCKKFRHDYPYSLDTWFLDVVDIAVLDYLMSHMDAKHTILHQKHNQSQPDFNVMIDFGHAFCDTNRLQALAPLIQCCRIRSRLFEAMKNYRYTFEEEFTSLTKDDPLFPLLLPETMNDLKRKLNQTLSLIDFCRNLEGDTKMLVDM